MVTVRSRVQEAFLNGDNSSASPHAANSSAVVFISAAAPHFPLVFQPLQTESCQKVLVRSSFEGRGTLEGSKRPWSRAGRRRLRQQQLDFCTHVSDLCDRIKSNDRIAFFNDQKITSVHISTVLAVRAELNDTIVSCHQSQSSLPRAGNPTLLFVSPGTNKQD